MSERVYPHSLEAERAVLGAILIRNAQLDRVVGIVTAEDFYRDAHRRIYRHLLKLHAAGRELDLLTLTESLANSRELDAVNGPAALTALTDGVPHSTNAESYARIVHEHAIRRRLIADAESVITEASACELDAAALLEQAQARLWALSVQRTSGDLVDAKTLVDQALDAMPLLGQQGIPTGLADVDGLTRGLQPTDLIILAARPAMGKTTLAINLAVHAAKLGHPVAVFSLEMAQVQLVFRIASAQGAVPLQRLLANRLHQSEYGRLVQALGTLAEWPLFIDDTAAATVPMIRSKCRRLQAKTGLALVVIDYVQLMTDPVGRQSNRNLEVAAISRGLKVLAKELRVPVLLLSQLNRDLEGRSSKRPQLSDLRDSGALEQDADLVWLLWRAEEYEPTPQNQGIAELIVAKHRQGPTGAVELKFFKEELRFANLSH